MYQIPGSLTKKKRGRIKSGVALSPNPADSEIQNFVVSFKYYNDKFCGIEELQRSQLKKALINLRIIGSLKTINDFKNNKIDYIDVDYGGDYKKLYRKLPRDAEVKEHKLGLKERMFYFVLKDKKIFELIAISNTHFETDKVRKG